jgi:hypothetical protein
MPAWIYAPDAKGLTGRRYTDARSARVGSFFAKIVVLQSMRTIRFMLYM